MIPAFNSDGNLPPGVHWATWQEFAARFGTTPHRQRLLKGLKSALDSLSKAGCQVVCIDGSFVTEKENPNEYDCCWDITGVDPNLLHSILLNFDNAQTAQKLQYLGKLFPAQIEAVSGKTFLNFFQVDKNTGNPKGIVAIDLGRTSL
ncbi:DUF6932 family protein [Floridanema evergladense]|uniref:Uncharacterized protein n=1 Tax=Floridaenema evergladense BLCC-F167 TaxID=3153639 RepID=A0ABV4WN74_9CYAN